MNEAKSAVDTLIDFIKALTPAQADKLVERFAMLERIAMMHKEDLAIVEKFLCGGSGSVVH